MAHWWHNYPWRMIQTNLREIDMAGINAEGFAQELKDFGATVVTLNAAGIIASYHSNLVYQPDSEYLTGDSLKELIDACHKKGIKVIARTDFSKIKESVYLEHPEWAYKTSEGNIVNYNGMVHTCPNGGYQKEYMFKILEEVLSSHDFDGLFCNMSGFLVVDYSGTYHGPCHCENCKALFKEAYGLDLPKKDDARNDAYKKYMIFKNTIEKKQTAKMHQVVKGISEEIAINKLDYVRSESNTEITRPQWIYSASSNSRVISGGDRLRPSDNASVDFIGFRYREVSVSPELMALRQWQNLANSGNMSLYIMGRLGTHKDKSSFAPTQKVFKFHEKNESIYSGLKSAAKVLVMRKALWQTDPEVFGWIKALTESHVPFDELRLSEFSSQEQLDGKEVLVLGDMRFISDQQAEIIDNFVEMGGKLIATNETGLYNNRYLPRQEMAMKSLGMVGKPTVKRDLMSSILQIDDSELSVFKYSKETPLIAIGASYVSGTYQENTEKYMKLVPEHPFGPPELCYFTEVSDEPGIIVTSYGKGKGIYIPWEIGAFYKNQGYENTLNVMKALVFSLCEIEDMAPDLTPMVELNILEKENLKMVQLINTSGVFSNSYHAPLPIYNTKILMKDCDIQDVKCLNGGEVELRKLNGQIELTLNQLDEYEAIVLKSL